MIHETAIAHILQKRDENNIENHLNNISCTTTMTLWHLMHLDIKYMVVCHESCLSMLWFRQCAAVYFLPKFKN